MKEADSQTRFKFQRLHLIRLWVDPQALDGDLLVVPLAQEDFRVGSHRNRVLVDECNF